MREPWGFELSSITAQRHLYSSEPLSVRLKQPDTFSDSTYLSFLGAFIHWTYEIHNPYLRQQLSMLELFLRNLGIYTVIYYVFRKAPKQMVDKKLWV